MATSVPTSAPSAVPPKPSAAETGPAPSSVEELLQETLFGLTHGLPRKELDMIVSETDACEKLLQRDVELLEKAIAGKETLDSTEVAAVKAMTQSLLTPLDRYWTASSLVGRLTGTWTLPSNPLLGDEGIEERTKKLQEHFLNPPDCTIATETAILRRHPSYSLNQETNATLLAVHKKILANKNAFCFKKPVKPEDAPGYTDRIQFPMDLGMIRKMILVGNIQSFADLHHYVSLISHNCVKFNGRESDYGRVARDFETAAVDLIRQEVVKFTATPSPGPPPSGLAVAPAPTPTAAVAPPVAAPVSTTAPAPPKSTVT